MKEEFDLKAETWDDDPKKVERAKIVSQEILKEIDITSPQTALEYGCGTGLMSFFLQSYFNKITLCDSSEGMLRVLDNKIRKQNIKNMFPKKLDLEHEKGIIEKIDIIYTLMALHHIKDTKLILSRFFELINNKGYLFIADLEKEDGSFHSHVPGYDGHHGFIREELKDLLLKIGFKKVTSHICYTIQKTTGNREIDYPVFLMTARKFS